MSALQFAELLGKITKRLSGMPLDGEMETFLNETYPAGGEDFIALRQLCELGESQGWLLSREAQGIKYGRAIKSGEQAEHFSVDVVRMMDIKGPHHIHTKGEIGAILPISGTPKFDGKSEGWYVYGPGSDHHPTVMDGDAYILYLLPDGAIEFTGN